jgi:predicted methyltransferase
MSSDKITEALGDRSRPARDRSRDLRDRTADLLQFLGLRSGQRVFDFLPFRGYFTRLFANLIGAEGHVYAAIPSDLIYIERLAAGKKEVEALASKRRNVSVLSGPVQDAGDPPGNIDLAWISLNYHDLVGPTMGPLDMRRFNDAIFRAVRPNGSYVIADHLAREDSVANQSARLHRIAPSIVREQVEAAGFRFSEASQILHNPDDPLSGSVFARRTRYHTSRFILKFRKPD